MTRPRQRPFGRTPDRITPGILAMVHAGGAKFIVGTNDEEEAVRQTEDEKAEAAIAPDLRLTISQGGYGRVTLNLGGMKEADLAAIREVFNLAVDLAVEITNEREEVIQRAYQEEGNDTYARLYRPVPQLFVRSWPKLPHRQGLLDRLESLLDGARSRFGQ